jgi:sigma-B regulation protein RsbU (phosphoserine phosphatase)
MFSLRNKLILVICLPLLAVYLAVVVIDYRRSKAIAMADMERHLTELTGRLAMEIDRDMATAAQTGRLTADFLTRHQPERQEQIDSLLASVLDTNQGIFGTGIAFEPKAFFPDRERFSPYLYRDSTGGSVAAGGGLKQIDITYDYARWDWYLLPKLLDRPTWSDPYFDEGGGNALMCTYAAPFYRDKKFRGVVGVDIALTELQSRLASVDTRGGYCVLVSQTGTFVSHPNPSYIMAESVFSLAAWHESAELEAIGQEMIAGKTGVRPFRDIHAGQPAWIVFVSVPSVQWSLAAVIPEREVLAEVYSHLNRQAALLLGGMVIIVAIIVAASAWLTRPIRRLAAAASDVARGNLDVQVPDLHGRDEMGQFVTTFNQMVADLKENVESRVRETAAREAMERELQIARQIQTSLLPMTRPPFPHRKEFSLDASTQPAKIMAGDFFDFWFIDDDVLAVVMADVCGKGVPAALFMAVARTVLRNFSVPGQTPAQILKIANSVLASQNEETMFVTVFYGHYHVRTGKLVFSNAGHNPPYIVRPDGTIQILDQPGLVLGIVPDADYDDRQEMLGLNDALVLYTDGVTEARDANDVLLGQEGFERILAEIRGQPVEEFCRLLLEKVNAYRTSPDQDDVTILALRRTAEAP